ncbi:Cof-type HAD-IIB family hydrolase [Tannockella kyphosi]|uniref:Cof-type HAD-IIB family hydrolase n=1 Tax=Tannockella kyphosi TaxID=2899121 RepID=UPI0020129F6E|nr:Cof-type HAD-IIB family hydrolase [Tannockella kyphosi]
MKYKAIALDIDGTLLSNKKEILPKTKEMLIELASKGVKIILASGRPTPGLMAEAKELGMDKYGGYLLSYNGANVQEFMSGECVYDKVVKKELIDEIFDRAREYHLCALSYNDTNILSEDGEDEYVLYESEITRMSICHIDDFKKVVDTSRNKVLLTGEPSYVASIIDEFKAPYQGVLSIYRSAPFFIEVMAEGIDKGASLDALMKEMGITKEELISFGDGYNDLSMIEFAGFGVAMENAVEEVKEKANYITTSNDEEGIYHCLKMLQEKGEI